LQNGGGVFGNVGTLKLVRPTFTNSDCSYTTPCGSGCLCMGDGADPSDCVGCTCKKGKGARATHYPFFYCDSTASAAAPPPPPKLSAVHVEKERFVDAAGRERFFRGVNVVYKDWPWLPHTKGFESNMSFVEADAKLLASVGVNLLRLGVMWPGVAVGKEKVDKAYIQRVRSLVRMAAKHGIYCFLEPHQDEFNPRFCGEGVPDWWVEDHAVPVGGALLELLLLLVLLLVLLHVLLLVLTLPFTAADFPVPVQKTPFKLNTTMPNFPGRKNCDKHSSFSYIWSHSGAKAYQLLWEEAEDFANFWYTVASELGDEPSVIGGELWNEPFPGDVFGNPKNRNNSYADETNLLPFYQNVTKAIRLAQPKATNKFAIAYEPSWPVGDQDIHPESLLPSRSGFSKLPEENAVYAFHWYSPPADRNLSRYLDARVADAKRLHAVPYASEWNFGSDSREGSLRFAANVAAFEDRTIAYTGWQYKSYSGSLPGGTCTGCGNSFFFNNGSLNPWTMAGLKAPFAQTVAGSHVKIKSSGAGVYMLTYTVVAPTSAASTTIVLSDLFAKPGKFVVKATVGIVDEVRHEPEAIAGWTPTVQIPGWQAVTVRHTAAEDGKKAEISIVKQH